MNIMFFSQFLSSLFCSRFYTKYHIRRLLHPLSISTVVKKEADSLLINDGVRPKRINLDNTKDEEEEEGLGKREADSLLINDGVRPKRIKLDEKKDDEEEGLGKRGDQWSEVLSSEPRVTIYHNFLSKEECEYLINVTKPHLNRSHLYDAATRTNKESSARTSYGASLVRGGNKVIRAIEKRIADHTLVPIENGGCLHVLRYEVGQKIDPHFDYFVDEFKTRNGGQRIATLLMYLSDVEEGGETVFPKAKRNVSSESGSNGMSDCAKEGISVKPKMGDALLFWSTRPDTTLDPLSLHGSNPVIKGNKWACTKLMRETEFKI